MARTWLSIRVDLISGGDTDCWPRPGRIFAAARSHTFAQLATAIDDAFARWDRSHLHMFTLSGDTEVSPLDWWGARSRRARWTGAPPGSAACSSESSSRMCSTSGTIGRTCARSPIRASTPTTRSVWFLIARCPTGAGASFPTSTGVAGTATMGKAPNRNARPRYSRTCRHYGRDPWRTPAASAVDRICERSPRRGLAGSQRVGQRAGVVRRIRRPEAAHVGGVPRQGRESARHRSAGARAGRRRRLGPAARTR